MGAPFRFARRSLAGKKPHAVVSVIGIALSCALITAIFTSASSLQAGIGEAIAMREGAWQALVAGLSDEGAAEVREAPGVRAAAVLRGVGAAEVSWGVEAGLEEPAPLSLSELPVGDEGVLPALALFEGELPASGEEILLPRWYKGMTFASDASGGSTAPLGVGSVVALSLGRLSSPDGADPLAHGSGIEAGIVDRGPARRFRVSGFFDPGPPWTGDIAFTAAESGLPAQGSVAYLVWDGTRELGAVRGRTLSLIDSADAASQTDGVRLADLHTALLFDRGVPGDGYASVLWGTAGVLALVVGGAGISLISNALAISVSERTRQFGLLASVGATGSQIRRIVRLEALMLAAVGIPAGVLIGLAGTWAVLRFTGEGVAVIVGLGVGELPMSASPIAIALAVVLTAAETLVAAAVPARRAGRASAVDAIRQARDIEPARRQRRAGARRTRTGFRWLDALHLRLEGVSGWLAHRNLARTASRGRVAVASLAVSVVLLVSSGLLTSYLRSASRGMPETEGVDVSVALMRSVDAGDEEAAAEAVLRSLSAAGHVTRAGYAVDESAGALISAGAIDVGQAAVDRFEEEYREDHLLADGTWAGLVNLSFVDEQTWRAYLAEVGLDANALEASGGPVAIGCNFVPVMEADGRRSVRRPFSGGGTATLVTSVAIRPDRLLNGIGAEAGEARARFLPTDENGAAAGAEVSVPLADAVTGSASVRIAAVSDAVPWTSLESNYYNQTPILVLPLGALDALRSSEAPEEDPAALARAAARGDWLSRPFAAGDYQNGSRRIGFSLTSDDPRATERGVYRELPDILSDPAWTDHGVTNYAELFRQRRMSLMAAGTFTVCFAAITGLIAVANVFTTITTSIILRRREFAVLRSIGMGERAFRRMIAREAASYAARGFALGLLLSAAVDIMLWRSVVESFGDVGPQASPLMVGLAAGTVLAIMLASVGYALMRCRSGSIIEAVRDDAF
ncbi:MAG: ABC transporter permease [Coriobacteriaceae bacterium]|nr:ABC transporter permease [Coriobacteriaceae bacterium]